MKTGGRCGGLTMAFLCFRKGRKGQTHFGRLGGRKLIPASSGLCPPPVLSLSDVLLDGHPRLARLRPKSKQQTQLVCVVTFSDPDSSLC